MLKVVLSFDDGRDDFFESSKILFKYGLTGSFHITTGFVDGTFTTDIFGINRKPLSIEQLLEMKKMNMDISSHGDTHIMEPNDFEVSRKKMLDWNVAGSTTGFSVPNSKYTIEELQLFKNCSKSISYIRAGRSPKCYSFISKINFVLYKLLKLQCFYNSFNKFNLNDDILSFPIYSVVVTKNINFKSILRFVDKNKDKNKLLVLMFHSVVDSPSNKWEYSKKKFERICQYLKYLLENNEIVVDNLQSIYEDKK